MHPSVVASASMRGLGDQDGGLQVDGELPVERLGR